MSYGELYNRLHGMVPKIPIDLCKTFINDSWRELRRKNLWSFQLYDGNWASPAIINAGTFSCARGSTTITADATAAAAIIASDLLLPTPIGQRQFRAGLSTIYNIRAWDGANTITLDRPWIEPTNAAATYMIFQCYYPAPHSDHLTFISVRDVDNFRQLHTHRYTRELLDSRDPQRTIYNTPSDVVYYTQDQYSASPTYRYPLYELWGHPVSAYSWQLYGIRKLTDFTDDTDELPPAIGEDVILEGAKVRAYEWAESNKGDTLRNQGADFKYLMGRSADRFTQLYRDYRRQDRETVNNYFSVRKLGLSSQYSAYYSTLSGTAYPGVAI